MMRRWKCTVCGYIHEGDEPPESCPVCGADRTKFILLEPEKSGLFHELAAAFNPHRVFAHFPCGLMPTAVCLLVIHFVTGTTDFEVAAFFLTVAVLIAVPLTAGSGLYEWGKYFGTQRAPVFYKKLCLAIALFTLGLAAITIRLVQPVPVNTADWHRWFYFFCLCGMLGCVVLLGHYGSVLASQTLQKQKKEQA